MTHATSDCFAFVAMPNPYYFLASPKGFVYAFLCQSKRDAWQTLHPDHIAIDDFFNAVSFARDFVPSSWGARGNWGVYRWPITGEETDLQFPIGVPPLAEGHLVFFSDSGVCQKPVRRQ